MIMNDFLTKPNKICDVMREYFWWVFLHKNLNLVNMHLVLMHKTKWPCLYGCLCISRHQPPPPPALS